MVNINMTKRTKLNSASVQLEDVSLILVLMLAFFIIFMLLFFKIELHFNTLISAIANNTANARTINIENTYNYNYSNIYNASIAVYISLSQMSNYALTVQVAQKNKTIRSIKLNNFNIYESPSVSSTIIEPIPAFISKQYAVIFTNLKPFTVYNVSILGTMRPYCIKICPMEGIIANNSLIINSTLSEINITNSTSSEIPLNSINGYPKYTNSILNSSSVAPIYILLIHKSETITTDANGTIVNVNFYLN